MAYESAGLSGGFEEVFLEENLNIKKEEEICQYIDDTPDTEIPCEDVLADHKRERTLEKSFKCDICPKSFMSTASLSQHKRHHKNPEIYQQPFICEVCQKRFTHNCSLVKHMLIHTGEKPYECEYCKKSFRASSSLSTHQRIHTGEKPYQCDICKKFFRELSTLRVHKRIHTGEKAFKCDQCPRAFTQSSALVVHKRIHSGEKPYKCSSCGKMLRHASALVWHEQNCGGLQTDRLHKCSECPFSFSSSAKLEKHRWVHGTRSSFSCSFCDGKFPTASALDAHSRTHHSKGEPTEGFTNSDGLCNEELKLQTGMRKTVLCLDSCKCKFSESEFQEIIARKRSKCPKCELYFSSETLYKAGGQCIEWTSTSPLESFCEDSTINLQGQNTEAVSVKCEITEDASTSLEQNNAEDLPESVDSLF